MLVSLVSSPTSSRTDDALLPLPPPSAPDGEAAELERLEEAARSLAEGLASVRPGDDRLRLARALALNVVDVLSDLSLR